jgi:hypothetical protein
MVLFDKKKKKFKKALLCLFCKIKNKKIIKTHIWKFFENKAFFFQKLFIDRYKSYISRHNPNRPLVIREE